MKTILVVDDNREIRSLVRYTLAGRYKVVEARNADEAYVLIGNSVPDALILDIMMPGTMDGLALCRKLKHEDGLWTLPIIFLTARRQDEDIKQGIGAGAEIYISKPFSPQALLKHVDGLFRDEVSV